MSDKIPPVVETFFAEGQKEFTRVLTVLRGLGFKLPDPVIHTTIKDDIAYEDDGSTRCAGKRYSYYGIVPVGRELSHVLEEVSSFRNGSQDSCIVYDADIIVRLIDSRTKYMCSGFNVAPYMYDSYVRCSHTRISYSNHGVSKLDTRGVVRIADFLQDIFRLQELERAVQQLTDNQEQ